MPIPSLSSSLKPRSQIGRPKDVPSRPEFLRRPTHEGLTDCTTASTSQSVKREPQNVDQVEQSSGDKVKRSSFLPQRGLPKSIPRPSSLASPSVPNRKVEDILPDPSTSPTRTIPPASSHQANMHGTTQGRLRPRSLYQPSSVRHDVSKERNREPHTSSIHPPGTSSKGKQPVGLSRSQSLRRPGTSTQPTPSTNIRGHSRTQSTSVVTATRDDSTEPEPRGARQKSFLVPPSNITKPTSRPPADASTGATRTSARLEALKRSTNPRAKPEATSVRATSTASTDSVDSLPSQARRREVSREEPKKSTRPAFSTLQQHFTPRKTGKAPTSTFLHPTQDTSSHSLPPETISLQSELLQLHLLHEASTVTSKRWETHAQNSLRAKFDEVASLYEVMREHEQHDQEQKNILALREWSRSNSLSSLVEHIQALSGPLHELPSLLDHGGRFYRLADEFERWTSSVERIWASREDIEGDDRESGSIEGLGDSWEEENAGLTRKLTAFSRELEKLADPAPGSSIERIVSTCKQLLNGLLTELQIMQTIAAGIAVREDQWIEARLQTIARDVGARLEANEEKGAWCVED